MSIEQEIKNQITVDGDALREKASTAQGVDNTTGTLLWATEHVFGPILRKQQDAILRLAREIDDLKGESPS
ncbi:MAG TPA: hypothetical protein VFL77_04365 [Solirubrobacterales bacterium]|nr:hypothetical protein [Solirubrobacterales bacterium]